MRNLREQNILGIQLSKRRRGKHFLNNLNQVQHADLSLVIFILYLAISILFAHKNIDNDLTLQMLG